MKADWIIECYKNRKRVSENDYLVGNSKPSDKNNPNVLENSTNSSLPVDTDDLEPSMSSLFKRPSLSQTEQPEIEEVAHEPEPEVQEDSNVIMPPPQNILANRSMLMESPVRKSPRSKSVFVTDETESPALRHKRLKELVPTRKSYSPASPSTPKSGSSDNDHNISNLVADMATPQRQITYHVLKEMQTKESPKTRKLRKLLETPYSSQTAGNAPPSPMPDLPDCMKSPELKIGELIHFRIFSIKLTRLFR